MQIGGHLVLLPVEALQYTRRADWYGVAVADCGVQLQGVLLLLSRFYGLILVAAAGGGAMHYEVTLQCYINGGFGVCIVAGDGGEAQKTDP